MQTIQLDPATWDISLTIAGNIQEAAQNYSLAQDAASAIKLFQGELWYDTAQGIPYWRDVLGKAPPLSLVRKLFVQAALTVPGAVAAKCFFTSFSARLISGQIQVTDKFGKITAATF